MYVPTAFADHEIAWIDDVVARHPLAQLVTITPDGLDANPVPLLLERDADGTAGLVGHLAKANPQWATVVAGTEALVIFTGEEGYVSPSWYPSKAEHGRAVPTWNYETVHVRGELIVHHDSAWKRALVARLTDRHEAHRPQPWHLDDAPPEFIDAMLGAIVGIEVRVRSVEAKRKLSQNRAAADVDGVIAGLTASASAPASPHGTPHGSAHESAHARLAAAMTAVHPRA